MFQDIPIQNIQHVVKVVLFPGFFYYLVAFVDPWRPGFCGFSVLEGGGF